MAGLLNGYKGDIPYNDNYEYISDMFIYAALCCQNYLIINKEQFHNEKSGVEIVSGGYRYSEIIRFLQKKTLYTDENPMDLQEIYGVITERIDFSKSCGLNFPLEILSKKLGLDYTAKWILILSLTSALDWDFKKIFRFISGDAELNYPTVGLYTCIFAEETESYNINEYALIQKYFSGLRILFPEITTEEPFYAQKLYCDSRLTELIMDIELYNNDENNILELPPMFFREKELNILSEFAGELEYPLFFITGARGTGKKLLIKHFAGQNNSDVIFFSIKEHIKNQQYSKTDIIGPLCYSVRECVLHTKPLAVIGTELLTPEQRDELIRWINKNIKAIVQLIFLLSDDEKYKQGIEKIYHIELNIFDESQRAELWKFYLQNYSLEENFNTEALANTFVITPGQMLGAVEQTVLNSRNKNREIRENEIYQACYSQLEHKLADKSTKIKPSFQWDELKMPAEDKKILEDICNCVKNKHIVMNEWNFRKIVPYGAGITILFAGPPGTGKTMAAQVIAGQLHMELYKIDLSQVIDKYVGETEKNIKQIFEQAAKSNSILFFDEADAIFSKRLEATNANERFANIESSLLLQCVEEYSGVTILATNNYNAMDPAFMRRFKYYVLFHEPDRAIRYEIWKNIFPKEAPVKSDVDYGTLADVFEFTGAVIKNVALSAAYLAAGEKRDITILDILKSVRREMAKNNLILSKEKLGDLGYLYDDVIEIY